MPRSHAIIWLLLIAWNHPDATAQELVSGIYIMVTPQKKVPCTHEARMIVADQKVCISKKPIISDDELTYASDISYDPRYQLHYIDIGLSASGSATLTQTINSLPDSRFALALEGRVICVFTADPTIAIRSFRIGTDVSLKDLQAIHDVLKNVKFN